jgi:hypothetical protein
MRTRKGGGAARSFCRAFVYCAQAVFRSCWSMASQNVVSTCAGERVSWGIGVGDGEGEGNGVGEGIDVDEGEEPPWGEAVADEGCDPSVAPMGAAFAPWNKTTPALSTRKSERCISGLRRARISTSAARSMIPPPICQIGSPRLSRITFIDTRSSF